MTGTGNVTNNYMFNSIDHFSQDFMCRIVNLPVISKPKKYTMKTTMAMWILTPMMMTC